MTSIPPFAAHHRASDNQWQTLQSHLLGVSELAGRFAKKLELKQQGELLGLLHDLGSDYYVLIVGACKMDTAKVGEVDNTCHSLI